MPAPTRVAWVAGTNSGAATLTLTNPTGAQTGDRIIAFVSHTGSAATITNLQGWTLLSTLTFNTRKWHILERAYASSYTDLTLSTAEGMLWVTTAYRPTSGYSFGSTSVGSTWRRVDNGGSINTTQAPSMTAGADTLALAFFSETSTGAEVEANTTLAGTGWSKWFWSKATAGDANPINFVAYAEPSAGATGTATTTWLNNSNNGAGVQLLVPQVSDGVSLTASGSLTLGLSAVASVGVSRTAAGSLALGASAVRTVGVSRSVSLALNLDSSAVAVSTVSRVSEAVLTVDVVASVEVGVDREATGFLEVAGGAESSSMVSRTAELTAELTATAVLPAAVARTATLVCSLTMTAHIRPAFAAVLTLSASTETLTLTTDLPALELSATVPQLTLEAAW